MKWERIQCLRDAAKIGWASLSLYKHLDPYLAWASASGLIDKPTKLPLLIRVSLPGGQNNRDSRAFLTDSVCTARVLGIVPGYVVHLPLPNSPLPVVYDFAAVLGLPRLTDPVPIIRTDAEPEYADPSSKEPLIAIVDDGCPFAHEAYRITDQSGKPRTRVLYLWDQNEHHDATWRNLSTSDSSGTRRFGFELDRLAMNQLMEGIMKEHRGVVDEDACYRAAGLHNLVGATFSHGAHMMGLATGAPNPLAAPDCPESLRNDDAGRSDIIFVQLPRETMRDTSGGSLARHVIDALSYIEERTKSKEGGKTVVRPVIINISVGAAAGAHDGTSLIEQAIDDFVHRRPYCAVMLAAGNARARAMHDRFELGEKEVRSLRWNLPPDNTNEALLELWYPRVDDDGGSDAGLAVRVIPPGGLPPSDWVEPGGTQFLDDPSVSGDGTRVICGLISAIRPSNSTSGNVVLLAIAPTAVATFDRSMVHAGVLANPRPLAPAGEWTVEIANRSQTQLSVDAWIERSDSAFGGRGKQSDFGDPDHVAKPNDVTLGNLAQGDKTVVIGACAGREPRRPDRHSGEGPGRRGLGRDGPDLAAPSDEGDELPPGLLAPGVHTGQWNRLGGTSAATAFATRVLYNRWCNDPSLIGDWNHIKENFKPDLPRSPSEPKTRLGKGRLVLPECPAPTSAVATGPTHASRRRRQQATRRARGP